MDNEQIYLLAEKRVKAKKKFRSHLFSFIGLSIFFIALNLFTSTQVFWAIFPILGIGLGVFFHGIKVYGGMNSESWEEKELEKEVRRMQRRNGHNTRALPPLEKEDDPDGLELKELKKEKAWNDDDLV